MKTIKKHDLVLCKIQARIFEKSINLNTSSPIFVRRFMNSKIVTHLDSRLFLSEANSELDVYWELEKEYGPFDFGQIKYPKEVLHWMGYLYRYWACTYDYTSKQLYEIIPGKELAELYYGYHSLSIPQAIERIMEAKNIDNKEVDELELIRKRHHQ